MIAPDQLIALVLTGAVLGACGAPSPTRPAAATPAQTDAHAAIAATPSPAGLCFARFTLGRAEIVLDACPPLAPAAKEARLAQLRALDEVEYADIIATLAPAGCAS